MKDNSDKLAEEIMENIAARGEDFKPTVLLVVGQKNNFMVDGILAKLREEKDVKILLCSEEEYRDLNGKQEEYLMDSLPVVLRGGSGHNNLTIECTIARGERIPHLKRAGFDRRRK